MNAVNISGSYNECYCHTLLCHGVRNLHMDVSREVLKAGIKNTGFRDVMTCSQVEMFECSEEPLAFFFSLCDVQLIFVACTSYSSMWFFS